MVEPVRQVQCPRCGARVAWVAQSRFRPFCSERCRMADLGAWATERYRVAGPGPEPGDDEALDQRAEG
ncbi:MAG: DNA gyrase inhibitor YacG [Burkholderiales bacterium]|nr:DNA gyrase inhibitor YacG [Burkholderiales bacterium]